MRKIRLFPVALLALISFACTDSSNSPLEVGGGTGISLAPRYVYLGGQQSAAINRIRLTAVNSATGAAVASQVFDVSDTGEWNLSFDVPADAGTVVVLIELINVGTDGAETVEWSGRTAEILVQPGTTTPQTPVTLFQGPPGNLDVTSITVTPATASVIEGATPVLSAAIVGGSGTRAVWSSLDPLIATVDQNGMVSTLRNGTARIVAVAGPRADTAVITVAQRIASIDIVPDTQHISSLGGETDFVARVLDPRGGEIAGAAVTWTTTNAGVAESLGNGRFRGASNGVANVIATSTDVPVVTGQGVLIVAQRAGRAVISPASVVLGAINVTQQFSVAVFDANDHPLDATLTWRSSNPAVASVSSSGLATAHAPGSTQISAVANAGAPDSIVVTAQLTVTQSAASVIVTPDNATLTAIGDTVRLSATAQDGSGATIIGAIITWQSTNPAAATVDGDGLVTAVGDGSTTIVATSGTASGNATVTVTLPPPPPPPAQPNLVPRTFTTTPADTIIVGEPFTVRFVIKNSGNAASVATTMQLGVYNEVLLIDTIVALPAINPGDSLIFEQTFLFDDEELPPEVVFGVVVDHAALNAESSESDNTTFSSPKVIGYAAPVAASVVVTPGEVTLTEVGQTADLLAEVRDEHEAVIEGAPVQWSSSNPEIVTVDEFGMVEAVAAGVAIITATSGEAFGTATVTVQLAPPSEVTWTGTVSTDWFDPDNWSPSFVPSALTNVQIAAGATFYPVLTDNVSIASLTQAAGSALDIAGFNLYIAGSLLGANITGTHIVHLTGAGAQVNGTVPSLSIESSMSVNGPLFVTKNLELNPDGELYVGANLIDVRGSLNSSGVVDMTNAGGHVTVEGTAYFLGGNTVGRMTAGTLELRGNFVAGPGANLGFSASGEHTTIIAGDTTATIDFQALFPASRFHHLVITNTMDVTFLNSFRVGGDVTLSDGGEDVVGEVTAELAGNLFDDNTAWDVDHTIFTGNGISFPDRISGNVTIAGEVTLTQNMEFEEDLNVTGHLIFNGHSIDVGNNFSTTGDGRIRMTTSNDVLEVDGNTLMAGGNSYLLNGVFELKGHFEVAGNPNSFSALPGHMVLFEGFAEQEVRMSQPDTVNGGQHFNDVNVTNDAGVRLMTDIAVNNQINIDGTIGLIRGDGVTATVLGGMHDFADPALASFWQVENLAIGRSTTTFPVNMTTNLIVLNGYMLHPGEHITLHGDLTVSGGTLDLHGHTIYVYGDFATTGTGKLMMQDAADRVRVEGNASFAGGSTAGLLTAGTFYLGGNFSTGGDPQSYAASGEHVTKFYVFNDDVTERTITMAAPGLAQQHFGILRVRKPVRLLSNMAAINIELDGGYPLIGPEQTVTLGGYLEDQYGYACGYYYECSRPHIPIGTVGSKRNVAEDRAETPAARWQANPARRTATRIKIDPDTAPAMGVSARMQMPVGMTLYQVQNTELASDAHVLPEVMVTNLIVTGNWTMAYYLDVLGNVVVDGGDINLVDYELSVIRHGETPVGGDFETRNNGTLTMNLDSCDDGCVPELNIDGNATFNGGSTDGKLTHGSIDVGGNFSAGVNPLSFVAAPNFEVDMEAAEDETAPATITFSHGALNQQRIGTMEIERPVTLIGNMAVTGDLYIDGLYAGLSGTGTLTALRDIYVEMPCPFEYCEGEDLVSSVTRPDGSRELGALSQAARARLKSTVAAKPTLRGTAAMPRKPEPRLLAKSLNLSMDPIPGGYQVANTVLAGSTQYLPSLMVTNLTVISDVELPAYETHITGDITVTGADAKLLLWNNLGTSSDFTTANSGRLAMGPDCDCSSFPTLAVFGKALFDGGDLTGLLRHGTIVVGGDLEATLANPHAFVSENVELFISGETTTHAITLAAPETQTISHVYVVGGQTANFVNGANLYGWLYTGASETEIAHITGNGVLRVRPLPPECLECFPDGGVAVYSARIENITLDVEVPTIGMANSVFGAYPANQDQLIIRSNGEAFYSTSDIAFETTPADGFYQLRAIGENLRIEMYDVAPVTEAEGARWNAEEGAEVLWGSGNNLVVTSLNIPAALIIGQNAEISGTIENRSFNTADPFSVTIELFDGETGESIPGLTNPIYSYRTPESLPGGYPVPISVNFPVSGAIDWPATVKAVITLDSGFEVAESNERDNIVTAGPVPVQEAPPANLLSPRPVVTKVAPRQQTN